VLPYAPNTGGHSTAAVKSISVAGNYLFAIRSSDARVFIYNLSDGSFVRDLLPGPEVGGHSGLIDIMHGLSAFKRANGQYLIFAEEDDQSKVIMYRWNPLATLDLTAYWTMDETSGVVAADSSANGLDAVFTGSPTWTTGKRGGAISLSGTGQFGRVPDSPLLDNTANLSITAWVRPSNLNGSTARFIISKRTASNNLAYSVFFWTSNKLYVDIDNTNNRFSSNTVFQNNQWYHIAVTFDGAAPLASRAKLYVNGVLDKSATETSTSIPDYASDLWIGQQNAGVTAQYGGLLDEIQIYRLTLTPAEVAIVQAADEEVRTSSDVGNTSPSGSTTLSESGEVFTIQASGADIWGTADAFHFAQRELTGDFTITARVTGLVNTDPWAKAGVMIRETLNANSKNASMLVTPSYGVTFQWRTSEGGGSASTVTAGLAAPYWVRLQRQGNVIKAYRSPNGTTWTQQGSNLSLTMTSTVYAGLAVTSHKNGTLTTATVDNVTITQP